MVASLMRGAKLGRNGWLLLLCAIPVFSAAQELADPTKPPEEAAARPKGASAEADELQSVIISPTRRAAIIHGQTVELGGKVGDFRLIEVNESGVVLQGVKGLEVLTLFPNVKLSRKATMPPLKEDSARKGGAVVKPANKAGAEEGK